MSGAAPRGIAVDAATALLIDGKGDATVVGSSAAYFLQVPDAPSVSAVDGVVTSTQPGGSPY